MENKSIDWGNNFQTPDYICDYMSSFLPNDAGYILEPTPGKGNLVKVLEQKGKVYAPKYFEDVKDVKFDWIKNNKITNACYRLLDEIGYFDSKAKIYYVSDKELPHDTFRVDDYPEIKLFSLQETLDFLEKNDDKIRYTSSIFDKTDREVLKQRAIERLKDFWEKNPDGMIDFG